MLLAALLVTLTVTDFGLVLEVIGATGSTLISYILPGVTFLQIFKLNPGEKYMRVQMDTPLPNSKTSDCNENNQALDLHSVDEKCNDSNTNEDHNIEIIHNPLNQLPQDGQNYVNNEACTHVRSQTSFNQPVFTYEELKMWRYLAWILVLSGMFVMPCCLYMAFQS